MEKTREKGNEFRKFQFFTVGSDLGLFDFCDALMACVCRIIPRSSKVGPVGDHVAGKVTVTIPVPKWCGERLSEHILQVISVVSSHPAGVGPGKAGHTIGLREVVGEGKASPLVRQGSNCKESMSILKRGLNKYRKNITLNLN